MGLKEALEQLAGEMEAHASSSDSPHGERWLAAGWAASLRMALAVAPELNASRPPPGTFTMPIADVSPEAARRHHREMIDRAREEMRAEREKQAAEADLEKFQTGVVMAPVRGGLCDGQVSPVPADLKDGAGWEVNGQPYVYRRGELHHE